MKRWKQRWRTISCCKKGFTLIEMLIVLLIISVLLLITVPNLSKSRSVVSETSCQVTMRLLQTQLEAYFMETGTMPETLEELKNAGYVDQIKCPDGTQPVIENGKVVLSSSP